MRRKCLLIFFLSAIFLSSCASTVSLEKRNSRFVDSLVEKGIQYYAKEDYENAGITLRRALKNYPSGSGKTARLRHSAEEIRSLVKICAVKLREEGLREYRNGNLENAIAHWRKILLFSKEDASTIKKMIETAALQLQNLEKLKMEK
jgi:outer membrane protein assembly factor BamD (BamD/ComL family)